MIQTVTIDIISAKALKLLQDLELMQLIRLRKEEESPAKPDMEARYKGAMSKQSIAEIDHQLNELRSGWE